MGTADNGQGRGRPRVAGSPGGIRTRDLSLERAASWSTRRRGRALGRSAGRDPEKILAPAPRTATSSREPPRCCRLRDLRAQITGGLEFSFAAGVAQRSEQGPFKPRVQGSNPCAGTSALNSIRRFERPGSSPQAARSPAEMKSGWGHAVVAECFAEKLRRQATDTVSDVIHVRFLDCISGERLGQLARHIDADLSHRLYERPALWTQTTRTSSGRAVTQLGLTGADVSTGDSSRAVADPLLLCQLNQDTREPRCDEQLPVGLDRNRPGDAAGPRVKRLLHN